jgi:3-(3-hydroxy-phenyl)propionate hydroxylase
VRLDDLLRPGFAIVAASPEPLRWLSADSLRLWQRLGGEQVVIGNGPSGEAADGALALTEQGNLFSEWLRANEVAAVVVRPDRYVFGGAANEAQLNDLVARVAAGLSVK